jgi:hypothetical protein
MMLAGKQVDGWFKLAGEGRLLERIRTERNDALSKRLWELGPVEREAVLVALPVLEELAERLAGPEPGSPSGSNR